MSYLTEKAIGELLDYNFFIPSYQRGYRWTERQVEDLLEDINAFIPTQIEKSDEKTWYCLQPVVVKECDEETKSKNDLQGIWYELIDGQQRLTSIFLIIHYANEMWLGKQKAPEFKLKYETRDEENGEQKKGSYEFLKKQQINGLKDEAEINNENIDYYHISKAYNKIHDWFKNYKSEYNKDFDNNDFQSKLKSYSKVIWYEIDSGKDAIEIFTRINMGKIPLTNAELIKALFLNSSNFPNSESEEIRLRQLEIASEWDRIEYSLQNEELWYFINNSENELPARIEHIFNIIKNIEGIQNGNDQYSTFRFFSEKFKSNTKVEIENNWKEIKRIFQTIEEWFLDRELYHKVGFLITSGEKITDLLKEVKNIQKKKFIKSLNYKIADKVQFDNLDELEYGKDSSKIRRILLFHNIQTMLQNKNETSRFPFDRYKNEKWDIEHIHAISTEVKVKEENQKEWLSINFAKAEKPNDEELNKKIAAIINLGESIPEEDFQSITEYVLGEEVKVKEENQKEWLSINFAKAEKPNDEELNKKIDSIINLGESIPDEDFQPIIEYVWGEEDNSIQNLCLLDRGTNRSYKNDSFKNKRSKIIANEKKGTFIPICTKNVFMKYYSKEFKDIEMWNEHSDRIPYSKNINETLRSLPAIRLNHIIAKCQKNKS